MFNIIFKDDVIDQGRKKINELMFTGNAASSYWQYINSGVTSFSLELPNITNNIDTTQTSGNIIVGYNNIISGYGGYNLIGGIYNNITNVSQSFIFGKNNYTTGLTNSFLFGKNNSAYTGTFINIFGNYNFFNNSNNNYLNILSSYNSFVKGNNSFLNIVSSYNSILSATTSHTTIFSSQNSIISGNVSNSFIFGSNNSIGYNQLFPINVFSNIFLFGSNLSPIISSDTTSSLSGTYINDMCVEKNLYFGFETNNIKPLFSVSQNQNLTYDKYNVSFIKNPSSWQNVAPSSATANRPPNANLTGLFLCSISNLSFPFVGNSSSFIDDGPSGGRWDMPSNILSANTIFTTYLPEQDKYIRYKG